MKLERLFKNKKKINKIDNDDQITTLDNIDKGIIDTAQSVSGANKPSITNIETSPKNLGYSNGPWLTGQY